VATVRCIVTELQFFRKRSVSDRNNCVIAQLRDYKKAPLCKKKVEIFIFLFFYFFLFVVSNKDVKFLKNEKDLHKALSKDSNAKIYSNYF